MRQLGWTEEDWPTINIVPARALLELENKRGYSILTLDACCSVKDLLLRSQCSVIYWVVGPLN